MNRTIGWLVAAVLVGGGIGAFYYFWNHPSPLAVEESETPEPPDAQASLQPEEQVRHPIPEPQEPAGQPAAEPLPPLNSSDGPVRQALTGVYGEPTVAKYLVPDSVVRRMVNTIDNLPREKLAVQMRPVKPLEGSTQVIGDADVEDTVTLSPENYERYRQVIQLVQATDVEALAAQYLRLYPLFQKAYEDLGYPGKYFNDRLVETIDHLLATPQVQGDVKLVRPKVFYEYADPQLERLSSGQKLLIRMGPQNAAVVKEKLRSLRAAVTRANDASSP